MPNLTVIATLKLSLPIAKVVKIMPKICQTAKDKFSLPNTFDKCQI